MQLAASVQRRVRVGRAAQPRRERLAWLGLGLGLGLGLTLTLTLILIPTLTLRRERLAEHVDAPEVDGQVRAERHARGAQSCPKQGLHV